MIRLSTLTRSSFATLACVACLLAGCSTTQSSAPSTDASLGQIDQRRAEARQSFSEGESLRAGGKLDAAQEAYRQAVILDPTLAEAWNNLGMLLLEDGTYISAADAFREALNHAAPEDPRPARNLGYTYAKAGWAEEALKHYETALDRQPNDLESLRGAVRVTKELNHADAAALERVRRAMLIDREERWRRVYFSEEARIKARMEAEEREAARR